MLSRIKSIFSKKKPEKCDDEVLHYEDNFTENEVIHLSNGDDHLLNKSDDEQAINEDGSEISNDEETINSESEKMEIDKITKGTDKIGLDKHNITTHDHSNLPAHTQETAVDHTEDGDDNDFLQPKKISLFSKIKRKLHGIKKSPRENPVIDDEISSPEISHADETSSDIDPPEQQEIDPEIGLPNMLLLGFQEGTNKKDVGTFINSKANDLLMVDITYYNLIKADGGYYWELQEGGSGHGVLSSILRALKTNNELIVKTSTKSVRIVRKKNGIGFNSFLINEDESPTQSAEIKYADKMKALTSSGTGFMLFGAIFCSLSLVMLLLALLFKYGLLHKSVDVELNRNQDSTPYTQHKKMADIISLKSVYIDQLVLDKSGKYLIKTTSEEEKHESLAEPIEPINQDVTAPIQGDKK
jgi:hypothetical protein